MAIDTVKGAAGTLKAQIFENYEAAKGQASRVGQKLSGLAAQTKSTLTSAETYAAPREWLVNRAEAATSNDTAFWVGAAGTAALFTCKWANRTQTQKIILAGLILALPIKLAIEFGYKAIRGTCYFVKDKITMLVDFKRNHQAGLVNNEGDKEEFFKQVTLAASAGYTLLQHESISDRVNVLKNGRVIGHFVTPNASQYTNATVAEKVANDRQKVEGYLKEFESTETSKDRVFAIVDEMRSLGYTIAVHSNSNKIDISFIGVAFKSMETSQEVSEALHTERGYLFNTQAMDKSLIA
ncbi:MAG: hypothetical protein H7A40_07000 [Chlamydiales bacterium]|nr:hypothetical protein [Chlamydiales bacterium]